MDDHTKPGFFTRSFATESDWKFRAELPVDSRSQKLCHLSGDTLYVIDDTKKEPTHYKFLVTADKLEISQNRVQLMGVKYRE